jgi:hypothetical protein
MGDDERADGIFGGDATRVADHVSVARPEAKAMLEENAGIHTGQDGGVTARANLQIAQVEIARKDFVGG